MASASPPPPMFPGILAPSFHSSISSPFLATFRMNQVTHGENILNGNNFKSWAVVVAQLVEWSLLTPQFESNLCQI